jgi:hypothetical protein
MQRKPTKRYFRAFDALYGDGKVVSGVKNKVESDCPLEFQEQIIAATWLTKNNILFYHVPNGGFRKHHEALKFKAMGVKAGVPDLCIPIPRSSYHGLYIELKRVSGGMLSDAQSYWLAELEKQGYACYVAKGANDLIDYVKNYLGV